MLLPVCGFVTNPTGELPIEHPNLGTTLFSALAPSATAEHRAKGACEKPDWFRQDYRFTGKAIRLSMGSLYGNVLRAMLAQPNACASGRGHRERLNPGWAESRLGLQARPKKVRIMASRFESRFVEGTGGKVDGLVRWSSRRVLLPLPWRRGGKEYNNRGRTRDFSAKPVACRPLIADVIV